MALTPKQEAFAQEIASGKSQADAYRSAFNAAKMKPATIYNRASELMADGEITVRVQELRAPVVEKVQLTLETHLGDLQKLRNMAVKKEQYSAAISAEIARGRAAGLYVEKSEVTITPYEEQLKALAK
jgi:hypothetical protein